MIGNAIGNVLGLRNSIILLIEVTCEDDAGVGEASGSAPSFTIAQYPFAISGSLIGCFNEQRFDAEKVTP